MRVTQAPLLDFYISKKIERRAPLRRRVIILRKIAVIIVLSTEKLKSIVFEDHDRISKMLWLCDPKSDPVKYSVSYRILATGCELGWHRQGIFEIR